MRHLVPAVFLLLGATPSLRADDPAPAPVAAPASATVAEPSTVTVRSAPLTIGIDADGHLEASQVKRLKVGTELWSGPLVVSEIAPSDQPVEAGAVLARFDSPRFAKWLRGTQETLENARFRLGVVDGELAALRRGQALRLERDTQELDKAVKEWEHYQAFTVEQRTRRANNDLQRAENTLDVAETEFAQLDRMYRESRIADDTKDIVLARTRRNLAAQRESTELARREHKQFFARELPDEQQERQRALERRRQDLDTLRAAQALAERQKVDELAKAERAVRDAQESLDLALADQQRLTVTAPFAGILKHNGVEVGDVLGDGGGKSPVFADLHRSGATHLRLGLPPQEAALLAVGDHVRVQVPDAGRGDTGGEVVSVGGMPGRDAQGVVRVTVTIRVADAPRVRPGLKARIRHQVTIPDALAVPRACITTHQGEPTCEVRTGDGAGDRRVVVLGPGDAERVQVLGGLQAGDVVVSPAGRK